MAFLGVVLLPLVLSVGEEMGWRGHLQPLLQAHLSALTESLVVGVVWAVWHLPVFYRSGVEGWILVLRFLSTIPAAVLFAWLFNNPGGSLLAVTVLYAGINLCQRLFDLRLNGHRVPTLFTCEIAMVAIVLVAGYGGAILTDRRGPPGR